MSLESELRRERKRIRRVARLSRSSSTSRFTLADLRCDARRISHNVRGIERYFDLAIYFLKFLTIPAMGELFLGRKFPPSVVEWFVVVTVVPLLCLLIWPHWWPALSCKVAVYFIASTIVYLFNVLLLTKVFGPVASKERTLILFIVNVGQIILAFAILYRLKLHDLDFGHALFKSLLVFGTVGHPHGADIIVGFQIVADFILLAVFLAAFVGNLGERR